MLILAEREILFVDQLKHFLIVRLHLRRVNQTYM